jgi:hypothetical protein
LLHRRRAPERKLCPLRGHQLKLSSTPTHPAILLEQISLFPKAALLQGPRPRASL